MYFKGMNLCMLYYPMNGAEGLLTKNFESRKLFYRRKDLEQDYPCDAETVDLKGRQLSKLTKHISMLKNLCVLNVSNNQLSHLPQNLSMCLFLREIKCSGNILCTLDCTNYKELEVLDCSRNILTSLVVHGCQNLRYLNVQNNLLTTLALPQPSKLSALFVECNALVEMPNICPKSFKISVSENHLTQDTRFCDYVECSELYIQRNRILIEQDTRYRGVYLLPINSALLNASHNGIRWWEFPGEQQPYSNLCSLHLINNKMEKFVAGHHFPALKNLDVSYNELTELDLQNCPNITHVLARKNSINKVSLPKFSNALVHIDVSFNCMDNMSFMSCSMTSLQNLDLEGNGISKVGSSAFTCAPNLLMLNLSSNRLAKISKQAFEPLTKLRILNLSNNPLYEMPSNVWNNSSLEKVLLLRCPLDKLVVEAIGCCTNADRIQFSSGA